MSVEASVDESEIIRAAYAERVRDAFKTFAEALGMGEAPKVSQERFLRAVELSRKARAMALQAIIAADAPPVEEKAAAASAAGQSGQPASGSLLDGLSAEDQALIQSVLEGTQGGRR